MIEIKHLNKAFERVILKDINCTINDGDIIAIIGPSGSGKSTFIKCINLLNKPSSGQIIVDGEDITAKGYDVNKARRKIGMVFQHFNLFSHLTIIENIMNPQIDLLKRSRQEAYEKSYELLKRVGLAGKMMHYPEQLSGGQKQRVAICRTLALDPEIILFDEPTSALDPTMVGEVQSVIKDLANEGRTMMIVTHEMNFAREISNRVFYMDEQTIYEDGTPKQIFEHPQKEKTKIFMKQLKILEFEINNSNFDFQATIYKIDEYCNKNQLDTKIAKKINVTFEELCKEIIVNKLGKDTNIKVTIKHSNKNEETNMEVLYSGDQFLPKDSDNKIALKLFENSVDSYRHQDIKQGIYTNKIDIKF